MLTAPRLLTLVVSLVLVALPVASFYTHLPGALGFVVPHRFVLAVAGYLVLVAGVLLRGA